MIYKFLVSRGMNPRDAIKWAKGAVVATLLLLIGCMYGIGSCAYSWVSNSQDSFSILPVLQPPPPFPYEYNVTVTPDGDSDQATLDLNMVIEELDGILRVMLPKNYLDK